MSKILLAMQYWPGDYEAALDTLRTIKNVAPCRYRDASLLIVARGDAELPGAEFRQEMLEVFESVHQLVAGGFQTGWPAGCNSLWVATVEHVGRHLRDFDCVLTIEADTCPLSNAWLGRLHEEWLMAGVPVVGLWGEFTGPTAPQMIGHINGNAMFAPNIVELVPEILSTPCTHAWDTYHAEAFRRIGWAGTKLIANQYQAPTISENTFRDLQNQGAVLLHGIKDRSAQQIANKLLKF